MKPKTKKILARMGISVFGILALFASVAYVFFDCWTEDNIKKNTLYCYACITSNIRNFPLTELEGEPRYSVNQNVGEPSTTHPPRYKVEFSSRSSREAMVKTAVDYLASRNFRLHKTRYEQREFVFEGKDSMMTIYIDRGFCESSEVDGICIRASEDFVIDSEKEDFLK